VAPSRGVFAALELDEVRIGPGFWGDRQQLNGQVVLDHCLEWTQRLGWVANFDAAASGRTAPGAHRGREFSDADVYKLVEAMCWEIGRTGRTDLEETVCALVGAIASAQEPDGYLNTRFGHQGAGQRYRDLEWGHELYCSGHLIQAGVARLRTGGDDTLVTVARRAADHVCRQFGRAGNDGVCGHPEIEMALVELYRATGEERYLEQARLFVERRGRPVLADIELGRAYYQDDVPVRGASVFRGHAVRALYLACGAVDVAVETDDTELMEVVAEQWRRTIATRTYLTGGMGSRHSGESFGEDHELPPDRAYSETCAGVASVMLAWRLLLATGEALYADVVERTLFNVVATSMAPNGRAFFYANALQVRVPGTVPEPDVVSPRPDVGLRVPWFTVSCCPTNVTRLLASLSAYMATTDADGIQLHQLTAGSVRARLPAGRVGLQVETGYPWSGSVQVRIDETPPHPWRLTLRVPAWASGAVVVENGDTSHALTSSAPPGYLTVDRAWRPGDQLHLELPIRPRWTRPDPRVDAVRGCAAVERGPLVYCAESLAGEPPLDGAAGDAAVDPVDLDEDPRLGAVLVGVTGRGLDTLIPYHLWGTRGPATMRVWLPLL
jgi:hypothetical protein